MLKTKTVPVGDGEVFRKNISKSVDLGSAKAKMNIMPVYIPKTAASDDPVCEDYSWICTRESDQTHRYDLYR